MTAPVSSDLSGFPSQTLLVVCHAITSWLDAFKFLVPAPLAGFQTSFASRKSPMSHLSVGSRPHTTAVSTISTLPELADGAELAARYLRLKLPQPELIQQIVDFLVDPSPSGAFEWRSATVAARFGCLNLLQVLSLSSHFRTTHNSSGVLPYSSDAIDFAAQYGHLQVLQWLHHHYPRSQLRCTKRAMDFAATNGHLEVVQWLHSHRREGCSTAGMDGAASSGHLEVLKWLHENREEGCSPRAVDLAAQNGHLEIVKWFFETQNGSVNALQVVSSRACKYAAVNGHLEVLRWLSSQQDLNLSVAADNANKENWSLAQDIRKFAKCGGQTQVLHWCNMINSNNNVVIGRKVKAAVNSGPICNRRSPRRRGAAGPARQSLCKFSSYFLWCEQLATAISYHDSQVNPTLRPSSQWHRSSRLMPTERCSSSSSRFISEVDTDLHGGFVNNPLDLIPTSLAALLQVVEKWLCPVLGRGFALYLGEAFSSEVLYGDGDDGAAIVSDIDQWRLNERVRHFATKFHGRVRMELRMLTIPSNSAFDIESAFEELFTKCVVALFVEDMANTVSKQ